MNAAGSARRGASPDAAARAVSRWLFACCALLLLLIAIGGITRLTRSGLSIPSWRPVTGIVPPIGAQAWQRAFADYRATPEYRLVNAGMTLEQYRGIYWWEYLHRLAGRLLGVAFALPLALFALRGRLPRGFAAPLGAVLAAGLLQGVVGWLMVASGLVDEPRVSHLRLAAHFALALLIFAALLWASLAVKRGGRAAERAPRRADAAGWAAGGIAALVFAQAVGGALMAGTRAGYLFPTFPRMAGDLVPGGIFALAPWPRSLLHDPVTIHFVHRWSGIAIALLALVWLGLALARPAGRTRRSAVAAVALAAAATALLGITTVLSGVRIVPAVAHQLSAVLLLGCAIAALHAAPGGEESKGEVGAPGVPPRGSI